MILKFEELESVEEMGKISDFAEAAAPWVGGAVTLAVTLALT